MNRDIAKILFCRLPYSVRRNAYYLLKRKSFDAMQRTRSKKNDKQVSYQVFDESKAIFVHIPKAAGSAVAMTLFGCSAGSHAPVYRYQLLFSKREYEQYFKFTFVRNPWDRIYSAYRFMKSGGMHANDEKWAKENGITEYRDFEHFIHGWLAKVNIEQHVHFRPQFQFLCLPGQKKLRVDYIGYFENIDHDFAVVQKKMGIHPIVPLPHHNKTRLKEAVQVDAGYIQAYTAETIQIVEELYKIDIEMFGYEFSGVHINSTPSCSSYKTK